MYDPADLLEGIEALEVEPAGFVSVPTAFPWYLKTRPDGSGGTVCMATDCVDPDCETCVGVVVVVVIHGGSLTG